MYKDIYKASSDDLVSIIIPCYNQAKYLKEAVKSALNQTYTNIEIIIVNDGSPDNTEQIALSLKDRYPNKIQVLSQENQGLSQARNNGIVISSGEYVVPLDTDDILNPNMILHCMQSMKREKSDIVYTDLQCFGTINRLVIKKLFAQNNILYENLPSSMSLYRKSVWKNIGGYKKNMHDGYEDWEFWINAYKQGFKFKYHPETLIYYRVKETSRDTKASQKDDYLKAIIVMNHPELYTLRRVTQSMKIIKETESLPDLYFYCKDKTFFDDKTMHLIESFVHQEQTLREKQYISSDEQIALCSLDILEYYPSIEQLSIEMKTNSIIFYSPMRYQVEHLTECSVAWDHSKGLVQPYGTIFPYTEKSIRENPESQLLAYKRLEKYCEKIQNDTISQTQIHSQYVLNLKNQIEDLQNNQYTMLTTYIPVPKEGINIMSLYNDILEYSNNGYYTEIKGKIIVSPQDTGKNISIFDIRKKDLTKIPNGLRLSSNEKFIFGYLKINSKTNEFYIRFDLQDLDGLISMEIRPWNNPEQIYIQNEIFLEVKQTDNNESVFEKKLLIG